MSANVGQVKAEFVGDSSKLVAAANQAVAAVSKFATASNDSATKAGQAADKTAKAVQKVSQETKQSLTKVEQAYQQVSYGVNDFSLAYHEMAQKVVRDSKRIEQASESAARVGNKFTDMGGKMTSVGSKMSMALTAPMLLAGGQAIKTANEFEFSMQSIVAMVGLSEDKVAEMGVAAREMAKEYGGSAVQAADALYFVASAGIDGATAMQVLEQSLKASAIGMGDTSIIADTVSSALNAYGKENLSAAAATDLMVAAVREGKMEADQLAGALPRVLPIASAMGVSFEEVGASFAAMSRNGTDASEAATQLRGILGTLLQPSKQAEETLTGLGLSSAGLRDQIKQKGLLSTLQTLTTAFGDNDEAQASVFGNVRALTGIMSMFGEATASTTKIFDNLTDNTGDADKAFQAMSSTGAFKMKQVMAEMKDAFISLGQVLIPLVVPALKFLATAFEKVMTTINALPNSLKTIVVIFAGLLAAAGPLLIGLGALAKAWLALKAAMQGPAFASAIAQLTAAGPIIAGVAVAVIAIAAAWYAFSQDAKEARERQERLTEAFKAAGEPTAILHDQVKGLVDEYVKLQNTLPATANAADSVATAFATAESVTLGINDEIATLNLTMKDVGAAVSTGTNAFGDLGDVLLGLSYDQLVQTGDAAISVQDALLTAANAGTPFANAMLEAVKAGEMTGAQVKDLLYDLHDLSNAFDDNREALDSENKKLLQSADTALYFSSILGSDVYNAILGSGAAMAEAAGRTDVFTFTLQELQARTESVTAAQNAFLGGLAGVFPEAVTTAGVRVRELADIYGELASQSEKGTVAQDVFLRELGLLDEMMANELVLTIQDAIDKNEKLAESFSDSGKSSLDLDSAYRNQAKEIADVIQKTAQYGGTNKLAMETVARMVIRLGDAARAAGYTDEEVRNLVSSMGLLDGIKAQFGIDFAINTAELDKQIANIEAAIGNMLWAAGAATGDTTARLSKTLADLKAIKSAIGVSSGGGGSRGGGGGGGGSSKNGFDWVDGWVKDIAAFTNNVISKEFAADLIKGSGQDVKDAIENVIADGLKVLPNLDASALRGKGNWLANLLDLRATKLDDLDVATKRLGELQNALKKVQDESDSFKSSIKSNIQQPLDITQGGALDQTRGILTQARQFKENVKKLQEAGFPPDVIREVANAGLINGNALAQNLLSMSGGDFAEFIAARQEVASIAESIGTDVANIVFGTDISDAQRLVDDQVSATNSLIDSINANGTAIGDATLAIQNAIYAAGLGFAPLNNAPMLTAPNLLGQVSGANNTPTSTAFTPTAQGNMFLPNGGALINGIYLPPGLDFSGFHAAGGIATKATLGVIGEAGPEAIIPLSRLGEFGGGTTTNNIVINMPAGSNGQDVVNALQDYQRRNGAIPIRTTTNQIR